MPQLDLLTFFTQFFWAILSFFTFYFFVSKLILPELTRVLKYRSKASALSNSADVDASSQTKESNALTLSNTSGKSGSSNLYTYAGQNSARVLMQAREKKDTFLVRVLSGKAVDRKDFAKTTFQQESNQSFLSELPSGVKTKKKSEEKGSLKDSKTPYKPKGSQKVENIDSSRGTKKKKKVSRDYESSPESRNPEN